MEESQNNRISFENDKNARDDELSSYQDECVDVSFKGLIINKYYFPLMTSKQFLFRK